MLKVRASWFILNTMVNSGTEVEKSENGERKNIIRVIKNAKILSFLFCQWLLPFIFRSSLMVYIIMFANDTFALTVSFTRDELKLK